MDPRATAGRIVEFRPDSYATYHDAWSVRAAIINRVTEEDGTAELTVFLTGGPRALRAVRYSEDGERGCWSWMPYQKAKAAELGGNQSESAEPRPELVDLDTFTDLFLRVEKLEKHNEDRDAILLARIEALEAGTPIVQQTEEARIPGVLEETVDVVQGLLARVQSLEDVAHIPAPWDHLVGLC